MSKEKFFLGLYMIIFAAGAIAIQVVSISSSAALFVLSARQKPKFVITRSIIPKKDKAMLVENSTVCVPKYSAGGTLVGGLKDVDISRLPGALRVDYSDNSTSQYSLNAFEREIFNFYLPETARRCWEISAIEPQKMTWRKDNKILQIAVRENAIGERTVVDYKVYSGGVVLGEAYKVAQVTYPCSTSEFQQPNTNYISCYLSHCPAGSYGCTYGPDGCPNGCAAAPPTPTCTSEFATPGTASCNYTRCQAGCTYGSDGCPSGCQVNQCTGEYQQVGYTTPVCNPSKCPSGCTWGSDGCPTGCATTGPSSCTGGQVWCTSSTGSGGWCQMSPCPSSIMTTCSGTYQQPNITSPSCDWSKCPSGCTWDSQGCPNGCSSSSGGTGSCPSGQIWCTSSTGTGGGWCQMSPCPSSTGTPPSCPSGQYWCSSTASCKPTSDTNCPASGGIYTPCPSNQYMCNNVCVPTGSSCSWTPTQTCPSGQYLCNNACVASGTSCNNYPYYPPGSTTQCTSDKYFCPSSNTCIPMGSPCGTTSGTQCQSGTYWCPQTNSCIASSQTCGSTAVQPQTPTVSCGQCQVSQNGQCVKAPAGTKDPNCGTNGFCDKYGGCIRLGSGQTIVGNGAICGNGFCDEKDGEDRVNCPKECSNAPLQTQPQPSVPSQGGFCGDRICNGSENSSNCHDDCGGGQQPYPQGSPYPGQFPGQGEFSGKPGEFPGGPGGQSEAEMQKMDQQRFEQMKRGLSQFSKGVDQMKKMISRMEKKLKQMGVAIPQELKAALDKAPEIVNKIKNAKTPEELEDIMADVEDVGMAMQEWGPRFGDLMRLGEMLKQVDKETKNIQRTVKRMQGYGKNNPTIQEISTELNALATTIIDADKSAKELAKTDPEAALNKIDDEFFGNMEEFWNKVSLIEMMRNLKQGLSQADREIKAAATKIKQLQRKKVSAEIIEELTGMLDNIKQKVAELKELSKQKGVDMEEIRSAGEELWQAVSEFENALSEQGSGYYKPNVKGGENINFKMPEGFMGGGPSMGPGGPGEMGPGGPGGFGGPSMPSGPPSGGF